MLSLTTFIDYLLRPRRTFASTLDRRRGRQV